MNKIVIFATHVVPDIEFIAKRILMLKKGVLLHNATPAELVERMMGRVWTVPADEANVAKLQQSHRVTAITRDERDPKTVRLRIICDDRPTEQALPAPPTPEDYYLYVYGEARPSNS